MSEPQQRSFTTPRGHTALIWCRPGTNDAMMAESAITGDEYQLRDWEGDHAQVVDVGAHIGMVSIAIALDHPTAHVWAIEPVPENVALMRANLEANGVAHRVTILEGAAAAPRATRASIAYDFTGSDMATMHRWVANQTMPAHTPGRQATVKAITLPDLVRRCEGYITLLITDCEAGEYALLQGTSLSAVHEIRGEYHDGYERLKAQLERTHTVERGKGTEGSGGFIARRKA